jgi:predicted permease
LLLVSAVNVGNMVLARALERTREIAVRRALGASRYQVVRQLAIESALLALLGGVTGALLAAPAARLLTGLWAADAPVARSGWTSPAVLLFSIAAGALTWLALAGPPIVHFAAADARGVRANVSTPPRRALNVLVGTQAALATVLLAFAVLLVASVGSLRRIPLGFDPEAVTAFRLSPPADLLTDPDRLRQLQEQVLARVRSLPGVDAAGLASHAPLGGVPIRMPVNAEDRPVDVAEAPRVPRYAVDPGFFETVRVQLLGGRALDASDRGGRVSAVVVNRALAEALWPGQDPVGKLIAIDPHAWSSWVTVVGVVENLRSETITGAPGPAFYVSLAEQLERETTLLVRGRVALASLAAEVRRVVTDVDPSVAVGAVRPLPLIVRGAYGTAWVTMGLLAVLALLATGLAALGIHAALSHDVVLRRREIALRLALGAKRASVVGRVLAAGLLPTTVGIAAGLLVALLAGGVLESLLFGVRSGDLRALLATASTVLLAALAAAAVSALRVGGLPPAEVLREE